MSNQQDVIITTLGGVITVQADPNAPLLHVPSGSTLTGPFTIMVNNKTLLDVGAGATFTGPLTIKDPTKD